jgi:hypothetical protein
VLIADEPWLVEPDAEVDAEDDDAEDDELELPELDAGLELLLDPTSDLPPPPP